jgi:uncharacterized protein YkwD
VNAARAEHGKPTLRTSSCAQAAAERWAERLASTGDSGHQDLDRVLDSCDGASRVAENIARTSAGPEKMVATWLDSSGHRRNILGDSTHIGSAAVRGTDGSWTGVQVFLTLRS